MSDLILSIRIDAAEGRIGPGKLALMRAIRAQGSLTAAAKALGMSYRRAWSLSEELNGLAAAPLIAKSSGGTARGGAELTAKGAQVLALCEQLVEKASQSTEPELAALQEILQSGAEG